MQRLSITKEVPRLAGHDSLEQFSNHLHQVLACRGFDKFVYYSLSINRRVMDDTLSYYCTAGLDLWMHQYLQQGYYLIDPLRAQLLNNVATLKFQFTNAQAFYQPFASTSELNQAALTQICSDTESMQLYTTKNTLAVCAINETTRALIDLFIAHKLHQGIALMLHNCRRVVGVMYLGYGGCSEEFTTAYPRQQFSPLETFVHLWHQKLQSKLSAKLSDKMSKCLTPRERDIIGLLAHGYTNTQIVTDLGISFSTVRTHINNILTKLQARNTTHACVLALHMGLLN